MSARKTFDTDLNILKGKLLNMVELSQKTIQDAITALKNQDLELANQVIDADQEINALEEEINNKVILMMAQQQPVASDLRKLIVSLKISNDVERVGDIAVNIAKSVLHIGTTPLIKPIVDIPKMAESVQKMLSDAFDAYEKEDIVLAKELAERDDEVDKTYGRLLNELMDMMTKDPDHINQITQLAFICRNLERVGDHATNISEHIIFLVKGQHIDLNA